MTCYKPLQGWRSKTLTTLGKRPITFNRSDAYTDLPLTIPCGQCIGCRLERSRQWAVRCVHEAQTHDYNSFITLTYDSVNLPDDGSLNLRTFQLFMKRLRKSLPYPIRYYHCGEYGELHGRPHYHACIFGHSFPDKTHWKTVNDIPLYRSASLEKLWPYGYSSVGEVTFESAAYVARYILKKINGNAAETHYERIDPVTGEINQIDPEYTTMSRRPGIGQPWLDKYLSDVFPSDEVIMNQHAMRPPKYYDQQYELIEPKKFQKIKSQRKREAARHVDNNTPERLNVRCQVLKSQIKQLPRKVE